MKSKIFQFDQVLFNTLFGSVLPILFFLIFWWSSLLFTDEERTIMISAITGFALGTVISVTLKLVWRFDIYKLSIPILLLIYSFYNFGLFGFFMGVPVFHPGLGVIAGFYWIKRLNYQNGTTDYKSEIDRISRFTSFVIGFICLFSATFALSSKSTASELKHMLHLPFDISQPILITFIIAGGLFLVFFQYWLTQITMVKMLKIYHTNI
jgi:hypothetical protein